MHTKPAAGVSVKIINYSMFPIFSRAAHQFTSELDCGFDRWCHYTNLNMILRINVELAIVFDALKKMKRV